MSTENEGGVRTFAAGEALAADRRVKLSSGTIVYADAMDDYIGVTTEPAASGALVPVKLKTFPGTRKMTAAAAITSGAPVYAAADGKVDDAYTDNGAQIGIALAAADGDGSKLEVLPEPGGVAMLFNTIVASAALGASSTAKATFSNGTYTIPAGEIRAGDRFKILARGTLPATNSSDTFTGRLEIGTEIIVATATPDAVNDDQWIIEADITVRVAGASGKLIATAWSLNDALAVSLELPLGSAELSEDISGAIAILITGQFSGSGANEARLQQFSIERHRK